MTSSPASVTKYPPARSCDDGAGTASSSPCQVLRFPAAPAGRRSSVSMSHFRRPPDAAACEITSRTAVCSSVAAVVGLVRFGAGLAIGAGRLVTGGGVRITGRGQFLGGVRRFVIGVVEISVLV